MNNSMIIKVPAYEEYKGKKIDIKKELIDYFEDLEKSSNGSPYVFLETVDDDIKDIKFSLRYVIGSGYYIGEEEDNLLFRITILDIPVMKTYILNPYDVSFEMTTYSRDSKRVYNTHIIIRAKFING